MNELLDSYGELKLRIFSKTIKFMYIVRAADEFVAMRRCRASDAFLAVWMSIVSAR